MLLLIKRLSVQLNITPGQKGLVKLTGDVPSWINFQDREKVKVCTYDLVLIYDVSCISAS